MTVSLLEILAAARARVAPLAAESAGYLLLAVADHVVAAPRVVTADEVELLPDGNVRLRARRGAVEGGGVEQVLRQLLARTLEVSSSVGPALRRAAQRSEDTGLPGLVRELEVALIPVNRAAAKRALSRLHRETERAKLAGKLPALLEPATVVAAAVVAAPVVAAAVVAVPAVAAAAVEVVSEPPVAAEDLPEPSTPALPVQAARLPLVAEAPWRAPVVAPGPPQDLTPEPRLAVGELALTKPEPVVQRARERGNSTPRLGTLVTLQTLPGEESERTERAPAVASEDEDLSIDVEIELEPEEPVVEVSAAATPQPLVDPEPSRMPDVVTAMLELHTGVDADEAPTRLRDVVTQVAVTPAAAPVALAELPVAVAAAPVRFAMPTPALPPLLTPEPQVVEDEWLTHSSLAGASRVRRFESERADPAVHQALTWNPGPVAPATGARRPALSVLEEAPLPPALVIAEPQAELSPYAPAVLPSRTSDVSELLDSFYVSDAAEERDLRSALKGMAGLELTPMPHPLVEEG